MYDNYEDIAKKMIEHFGKMGCSMSIKLHFLNSKLDYFLDNLGAFRQELRQKISPVLERNKMYISRKVGYLNDARLLLVAEA